MQSEKPVVPRWQVMAIHVLCSNCLNVLVTSFLGRFVWPLGFIQPIQLPGYAKNSELELAMLGIGLQYTMLTLQVIPCTTVIGKCFQMFVVVWVRTVLHIFYIHLLSHLLIQSHDKEDAGAWWDESFSKCGGQATTSDTWNKHLLPMQWYDGGVCWKRNLQLVWLELTPQQEWAKFFDYQANYHPIRSNAHVYTPSLSYTPAHTRILLS